MDSGVMTEGELTEFRRRLNAERQLTPFEQSLLPKIEIGIARLADINTVYEEAGANGGIWSMGRIISYDQHNVPQSLFVSDARRASQENTTEGAFEYAWSAEGVDEQEIENSAGDSEVATLQDLSNFLFDDAILSQHRNRLHIIISGNMGPCLGCQGRIRAFVSDLSGYLRRLGFSIPLTLEFNYTTATNSGPRYGLNTQYGYNGDRTVIVGRPEAYRYYSKTSDFTLQ